MPIWLSFFNKSAFYGAINLTTRLKVQRKLFHTLRSAYKISLIFAIVFSSAFLIVFLYLCLFYHLSTQFMAITIWLKQLRISGLTIISYQIEYHTFSAFLVYCWPWLVGWPCLYIVGLALHLEKRISLFTGMTSRCSLSTQMF